MNRSSEPPPAAARRGERGGARLKLLLVLAVAGALAYVGSQFLPAKYHAWAFEQFMQDTVNTAAATGKPPAWVEEQLRESFSDHSVPEDADVEVRRDGRHLRASVRYTQPISLVVTEYEYDFDVDVRSLNVAAGRDSGDERSLSTPRRRG